jgi:AcrR family transcriptional regulator
MNRNTDIPTPEQARRAQEKVLTEASDNGRRPSVLAVARQLGLSNTTFRRHFPDLADEISAARRAPDDTTPDESGISEHARLVARNAKLRRGNHQLREHLDLAVANIQRLTLTVHKLQTELEGASKVTRIGVAVVSAEKRAD